MLPGISNIEDLYSIKGIDVEEFLVFLLLFGLVTIMNL